ncbi:MAG TPA: hypothetical protein VMU81_14185 [Acetobacteraceae bacterium]|jgi:hypothetical protein|nr:hypothetical protein [Acetobacteraceae bacterium]
MATARRMRRNTEDAAPKVTKGKLGPHASAGNQVVRAFAGTVLRELHRKQAAGLPYSTLNDRGEIVFVHPDGTVRTGRSSDSPAAF